MNKKIKQNKKSDWKTICEIEIDISSTPYKFAFKSVLPRREMIELLQSLLADEEFHVSEN